MLLVYTQEITNRLEYAFEFIFEEILDIELKLTTDLQEFEESDQPKLNYSGLKLDCPLKINPHPILFQRKICYQTLAPISFNNEVYFFESSASSFLPFDPFAASFFIISRYEEYLMRQLDKHRRYPSHHSILYRNHLLDKPIVNQWAQLIAQKIKAHYSEFDYHPPRFDFLSTIDIDNAWAYKNKSWKRTLGAIAKGVIKGDRQQIQERLKVIRGEKEDPYDTYNYVCNQYKEHKDLLHFFVLLGKPGKYDRNISPNNEQLRQLVRDLNSFCRVSIHPSYRSTRNRRELTKEIQSLEQITHSNVKSSRQHFLRLELPKTYRRLINAGITNDYTMGYADQVGFRAGTSNSFWFYDLKKDVPTQLRIHPFQLMDVTLKNYLKLTPDEALTIIEKLMGEIRNYGGTFISLWHNESLSDQGEWAGWRTVFERMTEQAFKYKDESPKN